MAGDLSRTGGMMRDPRRPAAGNERRGGAWVTGLRIEAVEAAAEATRAGERLSFHVGTVATGSSLSLSF